ncbi:MarR family transcriptional regulator [Shewanella sp. VB17]|uniref:MarR family winged helix-turn-helix transcriptional regulator n=1 Tax=Shewanella sp. VB17 TaxID=2739432 RepID=UPI001564B24D|nr:MarR family transcriptional regulator [Shewanella sp. VB17]NRD74001.1 MarR family transcriptional regulator [Shewanella sp. VB17]
MTQPISAQNTILLQQFLPYRLANLAQNISVDFAQVYQTQFELTIPQWRILVNLAQYPLSEAKTAKELTVLASMDKSTVSRAVNIMLDKGLLAKQLDPTDKRASRLSVTDKGNQLYHRIAPQALKWQADLLAVLSVGEHQALLGILDKLDGKLGLSTLISTKK